MGRVAVGTGLYSVKARVSHLRRGKVFWDTPASLLLAPITTIYQDKTKQGWQKGEKSSVPPAVGGVRSPPPQSSVGG